MKKIALISAGVILTAASVLVVVKNFSKIKKRFKKQSSNIDIIDD